MRPPRLLLVLFCLIFVPILLTLFSALSSSKVATPNTLAGSTSGIHALFSFNIPTSLFPPSAIISLTDDNSTFFLARPAAFGPLLPGKGLSGRLWVGSGFGESGLATGVEGELGCSDIPGWGEGTGHKNQDAPPRGMEQKTSRPGSGTMDDVAVPQARPRLPSQAESPHPNDHRDGAFPSTNDGTDDHLHRPLPQSGTSDAGRSQKYDDYVQSKQFTHADIQSLQESAEIQGNVVLLSRGGCGFLEKVKWAQRRGAIAVIVGDDTRGGNLVTMYARGDTSNITIPALFTSHTTGHLLSSLLPNHSGVAHGIGDALKSLQAKLAVQADNDVQKTATTTTTATAAGDTPTPSPTSSSTINGRPATTAQSSSGFLRRLGSLLGICNRHGDSKSMGDSSRPPNSGNLDWMMLGSWDSASSRSGFPKTTKDRSRYRGKSDDRSSSSQAGLLSENTDGDDFVIGVQDWRDPDLMPPRESVLPTPSTSANGKDNLKTLAPDNEVEAGANILRGGSITPGSGEYQSIDKSTGHIHDASAKESEREINTAKERNRNGKGWFSSHFGWGHDDSKNVAQPSASPPVQDSLMNQKVQNAVQSSTTMGPAFAEHEGLWVTLTPTSMSTSPFFDTLLVLVISPLLTLTVVYALLLLRSRIRRRRWRAPKSVVERLPVRTYHTIASISSSSSSSSLRNTSPGPTTPASPLLGSGNRSGSSQTTRSHSQTIAGITAGPSSTTKEEKATSLQSGSILWRRKYTGRQVECVVCLEEYIDGQSRVMSLPCGHEFHADCITPWLTTRRRTCPICKGDVVRSMAHSSGDDSREQNEEHLDSHAQTPNVRSEASSAPLLITNAGEDADTEQNAGLDGHASSAPQSSWRNLAAFSFSALSGDTIWHQTRADRSR